MQLKHIAALKKCLLAFARIKVPEASWRPLLQQQLQNGNERKQYAVIVCLLPCKDFLPTWDIVYVWQARKKEVSHLTSLARATTKYIGYCLTAPIWRKTLAQHQSKFGHLVSFAKKAPSLFFTLHQRFSKDCKNTEGAFFGNDTWKAERRLHTIITPIQRKGIWRHISWWWSYHRCCKKTWGSFHFCHSWHKLETLHTSIPPENEANGRREAVNGHHEEVSVFWEKTKEATFLSLWIN